MKDLKNQRLDYTIFEYLYRDASNYKAHGAVVLSGRPADDVARRVRAHFESEECFIAENIGVPDLRPKLWAYSGGIPTDDDHLFHEFGSFRDAMPDDITSLMLCGAVDDFVARVLQKESSNVQNPNI